jgi:hypothetical protein
MDTLATAFWRAAQGRGTHHDVRHARQDIHAWLADLAEDLLAGRAPQGRWTRFEVRDPKPRQITAPCFADRVVHHAMMAHMGPVFERSWSGASYACRAGRGTHAAVARVQHLLRRRSWVVHVDVRACFGTLRHDVVDDVIRRRFKAPSLIALCRRVLASAPTAAGVGLPIGALTSQYFANAVLDRADRFLAPRARGHVRYMDDFVWFADSRGEAQRGLQELGTWMRASLGLALKPGAHVGPARRGLTFLGVRVTPDALRLSPRRKRRARALRRQAEAAYRAGEMDASTLQKRVAAAIAITSHTDAAAWWRNDLGRWPAVDA